MKDVQATSTSVTNSAAMKLENVTTTTARTKPLGLEPHDSKFWAHSWPIPITLDV